MIRFTRRTLIAAAAATVATALSPLALAADTIKIGLVTALSGQSAQAGEALTRGMSIAIDEINAKGGLLGGRKLELVRRDDEGNPAKGVVAARELIFKEKVAVLFGGLDTPVSMAIVPIINQEKVPFVGPWAAGTGVRDRKSPSSRSARSWGARTALPLWTVRIASRSIAGVVSLSRNPLAPCRIAVAARSSRLKVVSTSTRTGLARRATRSGAKIWRVASTPSRSGIRRSISTTSGASSSTSRTASNPSPAWPTTRMPSWASTITATPARNSSWSSTRSTPMSVPGAATGSVTGRPYASAATPSR